MSHIPQKELKTIYCLPINWFVHQCANSVVFKYFANQYPHYLNEVFITVIIITVIIIVIVINILSINVKTTTVFLWETLREKCPYLEFFWSELSPYFLRKSSYSVRMQENTDQKNSE